jgi:hypothetical protein
MIYIEFRLRTPDEADEDREDLPTEECVVLTMSTARDLADELDRLLRTHRGPGGFVVRQEPAPPDVYADIEESPPPDEGNGGVQGPPS